MKHTKGKWTAEQTDVHISVRPWRVLQGTKIICKLDSYDRYNSEANIEEEANAKLIAAAPDLLEALKNAMEWFKKLDDWSGVGDPDIEKYIAAIKKATE